MIGAIAGDIIGSVHEFKPIKTKDFPLFAPGCRFTDDSVLTIAVAKTILEGSSYRDAILSFGRRYPRVGYGGRFDSGDTLLNSVILPEEIGKVSPD